MIASAVTTPQPPAVVTTTTRGPRRQRLGGERGGRLERLLDRGGPGDAGLAAHAVEHLVVGGERAGVRRRRPLAARGGPALQQHERLALGDAADPVEEAAAVGDALDVGEPGRGRGVVGVEVEVVGDGDRGRVAGATPPG